MPRFGDWMRFLFVNVCFAAYLLAVFYFMQLAEIKKNWPQYRCNPLFMPFADDVEDNFIKCIQTSQSSYMSYLLAPLTFVTSTLGDALGNITDDIQNIRAMFDKVRTFFSVIIENVFAVFLNLVIEFMRVTIGIKDLVGKIIGMMVAFMYMIDGSIMTAQSTWNGPPGQIIKKMGKCFHPDTKLKLADGTSVSMAQVSLGAVLEDGSVVEAVMQIANVDKEMFYRVQQEDPIYVTGSHLIWNDRIQKFVPVKFHPDAVVSGVLSDSFSCLITNTHVIPVGDHLFWDWEDHFLKV